MKDFCNKSSAWKSDGSREKPDADTISKGACEMSTKPNIEIRDRIRELRRVPVSELMPNLKNWRRHPDKQKKAMRAVLQEIGYADALLARQDESGQLILIDGHLRADVTPTQDVPVLILDVTEAEADKILATLDPLASMAELDTDAWRALIEGIDADLPGFRDLLADLSPQTEVWRGLTNEDAIVEPPVKPITRAGDLWILGTHRLLCGDSTKAEDVEQLLEGHVPSLLATDPPYGISYEPAWRNQAARAGQIAFAARREGKVANDDRVDWSGAYRLFPGAVIYVWHASLFSSQVQESLERCGYELRSQIIWAKSRFAISRGHYHWQHECCFYAVRQGSNGNWHGGRSQTTLWTIISSLDEESKNDHGTQKPVELMRRPIQNHTVPGQSVYDPFIGSGTSIIAAETCGRICCGMEIVPGYVDIAVKRWQDFTGTPALLDGDGRSFEEISADRNKAL
jgi:DNA modification methylase